MKRDPISKPKPPMEGLLPSEVVLASTPSVKDGVHENEEMLHRIFGCELAQEASSCSNSSGHIA